jgi:hypothetical protein
MERQQRHSFEIGICAVSGPDDAANDQSLAVFQKRAAIGRGIRARECPGECAGRDEKRGERRNRETGEQNR